MAQTRAVLVASTAEDACPAVLDLDGRCSLDHWLEALKSCVRLQPLAEKVVIVGPATYHLDLLDWAKTCGLPSSCIIPARGGSLNVVQGVAAAVRARPSLQGCYILAADAGYVLEPGTSLSRLVEAAVIRGKDTSTSIIPFEGADLSQIVQVLKEDNAAANSKILGIEIAQDGSADGCLCTSLGPAVVWHPESVAALSLETMAMAVEASNSSSSNIKALGLFLQQVLVTGRPVYCIDLPFYFSLMTPDDFTITNAFFRHYCDLRATAVREVRQLSASVQGAAMADVPGTIADVVRRLEALGAGQPPSLSRQQLLASLRPLTPAATLTASAAIGSLSASLSSPGSKEASNSLKCMFAHFFDKYNDELDKQRHRPAGKDTTIPARFEHPEGWSLHPKQQHPAYATSSNAYGAKAPTGFDMPLVWNGIQGKFTSNFHGGCYKSKSMKTSVERSRVHRDLDYL